MNSERQSRAHNNSISGRRERPEARLRRALGRVAIFGLLAGVFAAAMPLSAAEPGGDAKRGAKVFQACVACHSAEPDRHLTGPSLAQLFGRKAGTSEGFMRYSEALVKSDVVWTERTLDEWLANPAKMIPGNEMTFPGIPNAQARGDVIAYLRSVSGGAEAPRGPRLPNLKSAQTDDAVKSIRYCGDTYFVTTEAGKTVKFWEFNLRLKTDSSDLGPVPGRPVLLGAGMRGDRASIVFSAPGEIANMVKSGC